MSDVPVQVIVAAFKDEATADQALKSLKQLQSEKEIKIQDAAVLRKDAEGKLHIKETADMGGGKGATIGGIAGGVVGLLAGPVGLAVGLGAVVGGLAAKMRDGGFSDERLKKLGAGLTPGSSAIVAVIEHTWVAEVEREMYEAGADVVTEQISADIAQQLQAGGEVAYTTVATEDAFAMERVAKTPERTEVSGIVATPEGVYAEAAVATKDETVVGVAVETDEGGVAVIGRATNAPEGAAPPASDAPAGQAPAPAAVEAPAAQQPAAGAASPSPAAGENGSTTESKAAPN
jgi:uncharacterized membrane protein